MPTMKIGSLTLNLPSPYEPGHMCTPAEARILNYELRRRIKRNVEAKFWDKVDQAKKEPSTEHMIEVSRYVRNYTLNGGDPVAHIAREIALDVVRQKIKSNGGRLGNYHKAALRAEAEKLLQGPQARDILLMAQRRVAEISKAAMELLERKQG